MLSKKPIASNIASIKSRRNFLKTGIMAASSLAVTSCISSGERANAKTANTSDGRPVCLDYGKSFICNTGDSNSVRMWIESRTTIHDLRAGTTTDYYQCGSCKSEDTFATENLFYNDNYDFLPIFGDGKVLVFRRHVNERPGRYKTVKLMKEMWGDNPLIHLPSPADITELDTWEKIKESTIAGIPIVTQTEIHNEELGLSAIIECPCKTININDSRKLYQTDTGPIALPDLGRRYDVQIDCLRLAFIAFNVPEFADFVIEVPTPILVDNKEVTTVHHYSELLSLPVLNKLYAIS